MGAYIVSQLIKAMTKCRMHVNGAKVLILGLTFKENCPDLRNTRIIDIISELKQYNCNVDVHDPWVDDYEAKGEYGIHVLSKSSLKEKSYDAIVLAVAHNEFKLMGSEKIRALGKEKHILYDIKYVLPQNEVDMRL
jgi:UDP-N-acetyl-D-galactosamine dehydrogenase